VESKDDFHFVVLTKELKFLMIMDIIPKKSKTPYSLRANEQKISLSLYFNLIAIPVPKSYGINFYLFLHKAV